MFIKKSQEGFLKKSARLISDIDLSVLGEKSEMVVICRGDVNKKSGVIDL